MLRMMKRIRPDGLYFWVMPTIKQARSQWNRFKRYFEPLFLEKSETYREAIIHPRVKATVRFVGADDPETLEGDSLNGAVLDEAARQKSGVWDATLRPMLTAAFTQDPSDGWADLIGKPRGRNHFHRQWALALESDDWSTFHFKSCDSPFFSNDEYEALKLTTPELVFSQEYDAEFIDDGAGAFRGVRECIAGDLHGPVAGHHYAMGVDLAKYRDFTVIIVIDLEDGHVCHFDRFNRLEYRHQRAKIVQVARKYDATVRVDATGVGDPIVEDLGVDLPGQIFPVKFTNEVKNQLVENLALKIENREITFPEIDELVNELTLYEPSFTKTGKVSYSHPDGYHDDCVDALMMAADGGRVRARPVEAF